MKNWYIEGSALYLYSMYLSLYSTGQLGQGKGNFLGEDDSSESPFGQHLL